MMALYKCLKITCKEIVFALSLKPKAVNIFIKLHDTERIVLSVNIRLLI